MAIKRRIEALEKRDWNRCLVVIADRIDENGVPVSDRIDVDNHNGQVIVLEADAVQL